MISYDICEQFRKDLPIFRCLAGWSSYDISTLLNISRPTYNALEATKGKMSVIYYLAIRKLLEMEMENSKNSTLAMVMFELLDDAYITSEEKDELRLMISSVKKQVGYKMGYSIIQKRIIEELERRRENAGNEENM